MLESVFLVESICKKHLAAPLVAEREQYLTHLFAIGTNLVRVRNVAANLLRVVRLLEMDSLRPVGLDEISESCKRWADNSVPRLYRRPGWASQYELRLAAANWLRFHGKLIATPKPAPAFGELLSSLRGCNRAVQSSRLSGRHILRSTSMPSEIGGHGPPWPDTADL